MLRLLLALTAQDPDLARAESLLTAGELAQARALAERVVARRPADPAAHLVLGRVHFARPVVGRYAALDHFRTAAHLAPGTPEPLSWQAEVGWFLGSDEGEVIAREALLRLFALDPDYRDAWARFQQLFQNRDIWRRAERALARHGDHPVALERRARLALALEEPTRADAMLARVLARRPGHVPVLLLRAQAAFERGRDSAGGAWYDSALAYADRDSTGALWEAAWMIATPAEREHHDSTSPGGRRAFFERFWASREPNLLTPANERVAEHFRRLAEARRRFRLTHPQTLYHRSAFWRALEDRAWRDQVAELLERTPALFDGQPVERSRVIARQAVAPSAVTDTAPAGRTTMQAAMIDARGLLWVRHGRPDVMQIGILDPLRPLDVGGLRPMDYEGWLYRTPQGGASVGFAYQPGAGLDRFFRPVSGAQVASIRLLLSTDRTTLPAPLEVRVWGAVFRSADGGLTDLYYRTGRETAAVALWDERGEPVARARGGRPGLLLVRAPAGRYRLGLDVDSSGVLGRLRGDITVPWFWGDDVGLSSLVLAGVDSLTDRETALGAAPASLTYPAEAPLSGYAEVYGLPADRHGQARYRVRYSFARVRSLPGRLLHGPEEVAFEFVREVPATPVVRERLVIEPGRVPAGRYRVRLVVTDLRRNVKSESVALEITIR
ncbi:MAG: GWxTD domain-containing protein [Gemmatimonadales bacterium]